MTPPLPLHNSTAEIFVPDGQPVADALRRVTHLGIGGHPDDLEFMALHGILRCYHRDDLWFGGVTCTDGAGSPRSGPYRPFTDEQMRAVRRREQNAAATVGRYGVMIQLDYPSSAVKQPANTSLQDDLQRILATTRPQTVYTHNPADKHDTHLGVVVAVVQAVRALPADQRPARVWGCEMWRGLDWLPDKDKVLMEVGGQGALAAALQGLFDSQIAGGKRYDLALAGRRQANATFFEPHETDTATELIFGMDLTPLASDESLDLVAYVSGLIDAFKAEVTEKLAKRLGR